MDLQTEEKEFVAWPRQKRLLRSRNVVKNFLDLGYSEISASTSERTMTVVVRTNGDPASFISRVRSELRAIDVNLPPYKVQTMEQVLAASVSKTRFTMLLLTVFSVLLFWLV